MIVGISGTSTNIQPLQGALLYASQHCLRKLIILFVVQDVAAFDGL
jgi:c-di-GMP-related signal transduction protein